MNPTAARAGHQVDLTDVVLGVGRELVATCSSVKASLRSRAGVPSARACWSSVWLMIAPVTRLDPHLLVLS